MEEVRKKRVEGEVVRDVKGIKCTNGKLGIFMGEMHSRNNAFWKNAGNIGITGEGTTGNSQCHCPNG